jgi:hypothetical protein
MRNTAQIWWAQDSRRGKTVLFSGLFITSFRKWKPFVSYKEGDDNVACKSKPIVTSPNHCNGTKAPRKGYLPPWASYSPASLRYSAESGPPAKAWPPPPHRPRVTYPDRRVPNFLRCRPSPTARRCVVECPLSSGRPKQGFAGQQPPGPAGDREPLREWGSLYWGQRSLRTMKVPPKKKY